MNIIKLIQSLRSAPTNARPVGARLSPGSAMETMEPRTLMSAVVFVGGWGSSMYQYAANDTPSIQIAAKRA